MSMRRGGTVDSTFGNRKVSAVTRRLQRRYAYSRQFVEDLVATDFQIGQSSTRLVSEIRNAEVQKRELVCIVNENVYAMLRKTGLPKN